MGSRADYAGSAATELSGTVLRLEKQDAGTVYVVRRVDEEDAVFLPKAKVSVDFVPGAVISFHTAQHKSAKLKYWAEIRHPGRVGQNLKITRITVGLLDAIENPYARRRPNHLFGRPPTAGTVFPKIN